MHPVYGALLFAVQAGPLGQFSFDNWGDIKVRDSARNKIVLTRRATKFLATLKAKWTAENWQELEVEAEAWLEVKKRVTSSSRGASEALSEAEVVEEDDEAIFGHLGLRQKTWLTQRRTSLREMRLWRLWRLAQDPKDAKDKPVILLMQERESSRGGDQADPNLNTLIAGTGAYFTACVGDSLKNSKCCSPWFHVAGEAGCSGVKERETSLRSIATLSTSLRIQLARVCVSNILLRMLSSRTPEWKKGLKNLQRNKKGARKARGGGLVTCWEGALNPGELRSGILHRGDSKAEGIFVKGLDEAPAVVTTVKESVGEEDELNVRRRSSPSSQILLIRGQTLET
ncbi:hypothetical protein B0H16DRAFT_1484650 [Mycena metata]|uniref:Uncharacterized protein n=1 Tax=Mycena metata TaxID=1033252 RepID=A0AAD7DTG6_9AGAR|nr:hypothetical protein B0H16DRAFT_1484650 [Mycena metata]